MQESTVTIKGQTTLPKEIRHALDLSAGDRLRYVVLESGEVRLFKIGSVKRLKGLLAETNRELVSLDEMDAAIAEGAKE